MSIAGPQDHRGHLPGGRSRNMRTLIIAGFLLILIWTIKKSPMFQAHYESGFRLVQPSAQEQLDLAAAAAAADTPSSLDINNKGGPPPPVALPGDDFYLTDALHHALHPPPPPPPPPPEPVPFPDNVAVIMETDPSRVANLVPVMLHFANVLGPRWPVVLVTLRARWEEPASPAFRRLMREQRIRIYFLPEDTTFPDHESVSVFLTQPWLWEQFESAGRVLLFQADSIVCSRAEARVDDFERWDLVGAPISGAYGVGFNGGLSLRNPRAVLALLRDPERNSFERVLRAHLARLDRIRAEEGDEAHDEANRRVPTWERFEDQWFYVKLQEAGAEIPPLDVARGFAVETVWEDRPLGYHQPFRWLTDKQKAKVLDWCPEASMLQDGSHFFGAKAE